MRMTRKEIAEFLINPQTPEELALADKLIAEEAARQRRKRQMVGRTYNEKVSSVPHYWRLNHRFEQEG